MSYISPASKRIRDAQERLLREETNGDFTVKCGEKTWRCWSTLLSQRCDFFKVATGGSFQESENKTVELSEETEEEVEMLLLYLYTLSGPEFTDTTLYPNPYQAALSALMLGDKYALEELGSAGCMYLSGKLGRTIKSWQDKTAEDKVTIVDCLSRLWKMDYSKAVDLHEDVMLALNDVAVDVLDFEPFQEFCAEDPDFSLEFMRSLAWKATKASEEAARLKKTQGITGRGTITHLPLGYGRTLYQYDDFDDDYD